MKNLFDSDIADTITSWLIVGVVVAAIMALAIITTSLVMGDTSVSSHCCCVECVQ